MLYSVSDTFYSKLYLVPDTNTNKKSRELIPGIMLIYDLSMLSRLSGLQHTSELREQDVVLKMYVLEHIVLQLLKLIVCRDESIADIRRYLVIAGHCSHLFQDIARCIMLLLQLFDNSQGDVQVRLKVALRIIIDGRILYRLFFCQVGFKVHL